MKEKKSIRGTDIFTLVDSVEKDESDEGPKEKKPTLKDVEREVVGLGYYKSEKEAATHKKKALALLVEMIDDCGPDREGQVRKARLAFRYIFVNSYGLGGRSMPGLPFDGFALLRNQRFLPDESGAEYRAAENWRKDLIARGRKEALRDAVFKNKP